MELFTSAFEFIFNPANWWGTDGIAVRTYEHISMSLQALLLGIVIAFPIALYIGHRRRFEFGAISVGNIGRALPSFGIVALTYVLTLNWPGTIGFWPTFIALVALTVPPVLLNTYTGIKEVDPDTVEAARGMGMSERELLTRLELPLAMPLIVVGIRTAAVQVVATATLGAFTGWGGYGRYIVDGFAVGDDTEILVGALLVAFLAIITELSLGGLQRVTAPRLSSQRPSTRRRAPVAPAEEATT
jgi:osmoprotectant transport system permease protein